MLAFGGMRPFEAMKMAWKDISFTNHANGNQYSKIFVSGKNKARWLIPLEELDGIIDKLVSYTIALRVERNQMRTRNLFRMIRLYSKITTERHSRV